MTCPRCEGWMQYGYYCGGGYDGQEPWRVSQWRCIPCGERIDKIILENRGGCMMVKPVNFPRDVLKEAIIENLLLENF